VAAQADLLARREVTDRKHRSVPVLVVDHEASGGSVELGGNALHFRRAHAGRVQHDAGNVPAEGTIREGVTKEDADHRLSLCSNERHTVRLSPNAG